MTADILSALRERKRQVSTRMLQIDCALTKSKREWAAHKGGLSFEDRTTLEDELANLRLERHQIIQERDDLEAAPKAARVLTMEKALCEVLMERGMQDVIQAARARVEASA